MNKKFFILYFMFIFISLNIFSANNSKILFEKIDNDFEKKNGII
jgi:hypothetical protein